MEIVRAFQNDGVEIPITVAGTHDNPLFRASDIGTVLDIPYIHTNISHMDETERVNLSTKTNGGNQNVSYLTELGLYTVLFRSNKPIAKTFRLWVCKLIKEIRLQQSSFLEEQGRQLRIQLKEQEEEYQRIAETISETTPVIYIYVIDERRNPPELKIGYSRNVYSRIRQYTCTNKFGKLAFFLPVLCKNIRNVESFIHQFFDQFRIRDEVFCMDVEYARTMITLVIRLYELNIDKNEYERNRISTQLLSGFERILNNEEIDPPTREMSTQTDDFILPITNQLIQTPTQPILYGNPELIAKFESFVSTHCIIHQDAEVSAKRIVGQYRLHAREAKREITAAFTDYLKRRFKFDRLRRQDRDQVVYGFSGVSLKPIEYVRPVPAEDIHRFVFEKCRFIPEGTAIHKDIVSAYQEWKRELAIPLTDQECVEVRTYLKACPYTLFETVWSSKGGGQGYYGIHLTRELLVPPSRTSSTGCRVQKTNATNEVVSVFDTIAKAAQAEGVPPAKMSRWIKDKTVVNGHSYVKCLPSIGVDTS